MSVILAEGGLAVIEWRETRMGVRSTMIEQFANFIPSELKDCSGAVFYSGRDAFSGIKDIYVLGLNPGGDPFERPDETIRRHTDGVLRRKPSRWSEYSCERWGDRERGQGSIQPSMIHLIKGLGYDPRDIPASNVLFTRTVSAEELKRDKTKLNRLSNACWRFHREVISHIKPKLILCLGRDAQSILQKQTNASKKILSRKSHYGRDYLIEVFRNQRGCGLVSVRHPGHIKWMKKELVDLSGVVGQTLKEADVRWSSRDMC